MKISSPGDDPLYRATDGERQEALESERFFHDMVLGSSRTGSWVYPAEMPSNYHMYPLFAYLFDLDLAEAECLDIGTFDGMTAFVLHELGARSIHATCQYNLNRFRLARSILGADNVIYYPETEIEELTGCFDKHQFDVVIASAMLHHLPSPLNALLLCRQLLKQGGFLVLEAAVTDDDRPTLTLNTELPSAVFGVPTLWLPSIPALRGMLNLASFGIASETLLTGGARARETNHDRVTFLARAVDPAEVTDSTEKTAETLRTLSALGPLDLAELKEGKGGRSPVTYRGSGGAKTFNIWQDTVVDLKLQPEWIDPKPDAETCFRIARDSDFRRLVAANPDDASTKEDLELLPVRYPGEDMPDGMTWGLKQLGNLFVLDHVKRWGSKDVLEVGAGFNFYFPNHLPKHCAYTTLDSAGFYAPELMSLMRSRLPRGQAVDGLIGQGTLESSGFDACISVSVLEHLPPADVAGACRDMFRVLRPGGWAVHSIDLTAPELRDTASLWKAELHAAGFLIGADRVDFDLRSGDWESDPPHAEPLAITMRFHAGYRESIWDPDLPQSPSPSAHALLVAARKPRR